MRSLAPRLTQSSGNVEAYIYHLGRAIEIGRALGGTTGQMATDLTLMATHPKSAQTFLNTLKNDSSRPQA